ncbi:hypothetical protein TRFO_31025 [Tritrichomonas foetus]|uniref:Uncharacterized protein n=1 Tax=Tritrichomonas foetus TaxID=1144522 RepID=A0A1J4JXK0_9EUKA|nr:hypothetical protein TRFO_31025 [Tritrichomonas foetus]|eukprot:OHT02005.1 hypothetical protein TRFO_31025 [Tritrichomonas foetus]
MSRRQLITFYLQIVIIVSLACLLQYQFYAKNNPSRPDPRKYVDIEPENYKEDDFNQTLPFETGEFKDSEVDEATTFLHLPISFSRGFVSCNESKEYSCFELIRAYKATKEYISLYESEQTKGYVIANLTSSEAPLHCLMSSFYNAFLLAMFTKRRLVLQTDEPDIFWLHSQVKPFFAPPLNLPKVPEVVLPFNFTYPCEDININDQILVINPCMWPQISYIHPYLAPRIRSVFGIHAAFYICNFLFDEYNAMIDCPQLPENSVACVPHTSKAWSINQNTFQKRMTECVGNYSVVMIEEDEEKNHTDQICMMKKLISADKIVYTYGSVLGWMAMAMQGGKGAAVDLDGPQCMEFRNSQSGSLIHTYNPKKSFHYSSNNDFLLCGPNYNDARLYERYLMW